jgi:allophanate hydrolase subunit 1
MVFTEGDGIVDSNVCRYNGLAKKPLIKTHSSTQYMTIESYWSMVKTMAMFVVLI